jgi:hypothetical protein
MLEIATERRLSDRRASRGGGRRSTDPPSCPSDLPVCPACRKPGVALPAGESDGGWWFVCVVCDLLWDQRQANDYHVHHEDASAQAVGRAARAVRAESFWRRCALQALAFVRFRHAAPSS